MAILTSAGAEWTDPVLPGSPPGRTTGRVAIRSALGRRLYATADTNVTEVAQTFIDVVPTSGPADVPSVLDSLCVPSKLNVGEDWFEKIHIYPGGDTENPSYDQNFKILFGDILAQLERPYEVFNAYRESTVTLNTINIASLIPGFETPGTIVTDTLGPLTSMLDVGLSTFNGDLITGLGTPVLRSVRALQDGLARFDGPVTLGFDLQSITFRVSGARVAMLLSDYSMPYDEVLEFLTDIIPGSGGHEQRLALRKNPREEFNCKFELDGLERQRFQAIMFEWQHQRFGLPLRHLAVRTSASSNVGANQFQITAADDSDFRVGGLALIFDDFFNFDIVEVSAITDTLLTIVGTAVFGYDANTLVIPVRICRLKGKIRTTTTKVNAMETFRCIFENMDNDTGVPAADSTAWNANTYAGKVLLDDCNILAGIRIRTELQKDVKVLDGQTGIVTTSSVWDTNKRNSTKGFFAQSRSDIKDLKAFLRAMRGKQVSFWLPTFLPDLTVGDDLSASSDKMHIENIDYTRFIQSRKNKIVFRIEFTDNSSLVRVIQSSADHASDNTLETLTLNATWPNNQTVATIVKVDFYELVRFNTDRFVIRYSRDGVAKLMAPVKVVFD